MMRAHLLFTSALLTALACGGSRPDAGADAAESEDEGMVAARVSDSLILSTPAGYQVWYSGSRPARDDNGQVCVERTMQIRRDSTRVNIPLLYTGAAPFLVNDSTIEAAIWLNCRPGNVYRVNLRTGLPVRVR
ncbi:MAG: hypothetical protein JNM53_17630 [Gemmatimonadetes bacterium]|nr:hypothetical protein [Gemmatimonadota bacterium]